MQSFCDLRSISYKISFDQSLKNPVSGSEACAPLSSTRPSPARYALLPASIADLNAPAIAGISPAVAIAVFAMIAAAPISIASQACEGFPIPASTITGRSDSSIIIWINSFVARPLFEPIGDASGMIAAAPAFARSLAV